MKETFEQYLQRLKDRRTEDDYRYTDEDFEKYKDYISDCCKNGMSVYKCLELMYFAEKDMDDQLFNREPKHETLEEAALRLYPIDIRECENSEDWDINKQYRDEFIEGAKWQQEQDNTANEILEYILLNDDGVGIALGYNSREMIEQYFKKINWEIQPEQIWNDEKREGIKKLIKEHKDGKLK